MNRYQAYVTTDGVEDQTVRPIIRLSKSHLNAAIIRSDDEKKAIDVLEELDYVECFAPNSRKIGMTIPYRYNDAPLRYEPDFVVRLRGGKMLVLEIKGIGGLIHDPNQISAKNAGAKKWVEALNNAKLYGQWAFVYCDDISRLVSLILEHVATTLALPFHSITPEPNERFKTCFPLTSLRTAAARFSEDQTSFKELAGEASDWITWDNHPRFEPGMFVARVLGKSMDPEIPEGAYCLFRVATDGVRQGKRLLVWHSSIDDPMTNGHYTLRTYTSEQLSSDGYPSRRTRVSLMPINPEFEPIVLTTEDEEDVRVIAELSLVLPAVAQTPAVSCIRRRLSCGHRCPCCSCSGRRKTCRPVSAIARTPRRGIPYQPKRKSPG
jgi:Peptidase S24-like